MDSPLSYYDKPRLQSIWIPTIPRQVSYKKSSVYDIPHTVMELLGLKGSPDWPWGRSLLDENPGEVPHITELAALHAYWDEELGFNWSLSSSLRKFEKWSPLETTDPNVNVKEYAAFELKKKNRKEKREKSSEEIHTA